MVRYCSAYGCKEYQRKGGPVTFHSFPQDEIRRKEWLILVRRANFKIKKSTQICSKHFEQECFNREKSKIRTWLKKDAKPTIFDFPSHVKARETCPRSITRKGQPSESIANDPTPEAQNIISPFADFAEDVIKEISKISSDMPIKSPQHKIKVYKPTLNNYDHEMKKICREIISKESLKKEDQNPSTFVVSDSAAERQKMLRCLDDFTDDDMDSPDKACRDLFVAKLESLKFRKKLQLMKQRIKRSDKHFAKVRKIMLELERKICNHNSACDVFEDGKQKTWDLLRIHDSVAVIIYNSTRQLLLFVKQFRHDSARNAGAHRLVVDKDQSLVETVREEVLEECGYDVPVSAVQEATSFGAAASITSSIQTLFYVEVTDSMKVSEDDGSSYDGELIDVVGINLFEARSLIYKKKVSQPTSLFFALMWFFDRKVPS